ncbi:MAG: hypothetical protein KGK08_10605 [Acidobacteriota bacterium]|nr:hypothetical protein [Acidobacteriota bacterium]
MAGVAPRHTRRYLHELQDHYEDLVREACAQGRDAEQARADAWRRLGTLDVLVETMLQRPQLRSWSARMPWLTLALLPPVALAALYGVALVILATGWAIFLPDAATPFQPVHGVAMLYFGFGRLLYYAAPALVVGLLVLHMVRQRQYSVWAIVGGVLVSRAAGMATVHAMRLPEQANASRVSLQLQSSGQTPLWMSAMMLVLVVVYATLVWRKQRVLSS